VIFSLFSLGYVLAAAVALALVPHFGWQSAFVVAIIPAVLLFLVRRGITESHRYIDTQANLVSGHVKPRLWQLPGVRRRLVAGWLIYTANAVGYWGMTLFLTTYIVKRFHASPIEAIRYALVFFLLQGVFAYLGTALADWVGRRPSAILAALIEITSTVLAATLIRCTSIRSSARSRLPPSAGSGAWATPISPSFSQRYCAAPGSESLSAVVGWSPSRPRPSSAGPSCTTGCRRPTLRSPDCGC
jgi:MFS family permease